ncbi:MAG: HD domain-containing protein, partial [Candidatus Hydrogenedentes bacterium]|nr:HD domain-containing protein [Candidatus Hydrogenedentota bacterium]
AFFETIHPLDRVPRAGFLLRGVEQPENVSAHSHFLALLTLLVLEEYPNRWDKEKALTMALIHDLPEAKMMDLPMPIVQEYIPEAKLTAEVAVFKEIAKELPEKLIQIYEEFHNCSSSEAKLVRGLDKVQMMIKVVCYEREHRGNLEEFWENPNNFCDYGVDVTRKLFEAICRKAGRNLPSTT